MIDTLIQLGQQVEETWRKTNNSKDEFSKICTQILTGFNHQMSLEGFDKETSLWLQNSDLPDQLNVYNNFGQPPLTIFNNGDFVVDLYFWQNMDTSIHSHSFRGAFKVLFGQSLHEHYEVKELTKYAPDIARTELSFKSKKIFKQGSVQEITAGSDFTHSVIHLEKPTVTLCIRTINDLSTPQWHHFPNGLSALKTILSEKNIKSVYYYQYLFSRNEEEGFKFAYSLIEELSISETLSIYEQLTTDGMGLDEGSGETLVNIILSKYAQSEWFEIYDQSYEIEENYIQPQSNKPCDIFIAHAINTGYSNNESLKLLEEIQGFPATLEQEQIFK